MQSPSASHIQISVRGVISDAVRIGTRHDVGHHGKTNTVAVSSIGVGNEPDGIAYDPSNGYLYVANSNSCNVTFHVDPDGNPLSVKVTG